MTAQQRAAPDGPRIAGLPRFRSRKARSLLGNPWSSAPSERNTFLDIHEIARVLSGKRLSSLEVRNDAQLEVRFSNGSKVVIEAVGGKLSVELVAEARDLICPIAVWPTTRQREYLEFITKYMRRFGISPAESDIQRHFLISAPSVNHMVQSWNDEDSSRGSGARRGRSACSLPVPAGCAGELIT